MTGCSNCVNARTVFGEVVEVDVVKGDNLIASDLSLNDLLLIQFSNKIICSSEHRIGEQPSRETPGAYRQA